MSYRLLRPILFRLDPEAAHSLSLTLLRLIGSLPPLRAAIRASFASRRRPAAVEAFGLTFPNRLGLAAGYDKDGVAWRGLACLGFGHVEIGTVTPRPQPGNPRPRVFRLADDRSLINRLGFPSRGAEFVARRIRKRPPGGPVVGVNLGKQRETPLERAAEDYGHLMEVFAPLADYLVVNVSSPNTPELRELQQRSWLQPLLAHLVQRRDALRESLGRPVPLLVKLSPDLTEGELDDALDVVLEAGIDGVVATNTSTARPPLRSSLGAEKGGLSGAPIAERSTALIRGIHERTEGRLPVIACGGVMAPSDAMAKLEAGARLVQLYTGLVYEGPGLVRRILDAIESESRESSAAGS